MATTLGEVIVRFGADTIGFNAGVIGAAMRVQDFKQSIVLAGLAIDAVLLGLAAASIKMAADFQTGLVRLRTGAGDTQDSMASLGKSIQDVSMTTGLMTGPLTNAMYEILSSGQRGAQAYQTLQASAKGAQIEQANVVDVTKAVTTAMTDFSDKTINANQYMNGYIKAVSMGKITLQDLSSAMGPILPTANAVGVSFRDMAAAMSVQTNAGIPAARAATGLRFMLMALENPTKKASDEMAKMGLNTVDVANKMKVSLPGALQMLYEAAKNAGPEGSVPFNRALADMVGGSRGLSAYLALTGTHMKTFSSEAGQIGNAMRGGKNEVVGWAEVQNNFNIQMQRAAASVQVLAQTIGAALLPIVTPMIERISTIVTQFVKWLQVGQNMHNFLIALGVIFAVVTAVTIGMTVAVIALAVAGLMAQAAFWPVTLAVLAIIAAIAIAIFVITHWGEIVKTVGGVFNAFGTNVRTVATGIKNWVGSQFDQLGTNIRNKMTEAKNTVGDAFNAMGTAIRDAATGIKNAVGGIFSAIGGFLTWLFNHNYYVQAFCQLGVAAFNWYRDTIGAIFSAIGATLHNFISLMGSIFSAAGSVLNNFRNLIGNIFSSIGSMIHGKTSEWGGAISGFVSNAIGIMGGLASGFGGAARNAVDAVGNAFSGLGSLASRAFGWGASIISGFIGGIGSMLGNVASAASNVASTVASHLGFHSSVFGVPPKGPGNKADTWMPALMKGLAGGIEAGTPQVQNALAGVFGSVGRISVVPPYAMATAAGRGTQTIIIQIDKRDLANAIGDQMAKEIRLQIGVR